MDSVMEDPKALQMRTKCLEYMKIHSYESAMFFARQLVCLSDSECTLCRPSLSYFARCQMRMMCNCSLKRTLLIRNTGGHTMS